MPSFNIQSGATGLYLTVTYTVVEQSVENNTTIVDVSLSLHHGGLYVGAGTDDCALWIGGTTYKWTGPDISSSGGTVSLGSHRFTVSHNSDGSFSGKIGGSYRLNITYGSQYIGTISGSQDLTLPTIPRASSVSATDANIGSVSSIYINAKSSAFTHALQVTFGTFSSYLTGTGELSSSYVTFSERTIPFRLPDSFYAQIPDAPSGKVTLKLWTHRDKDHAFDPATTTFTATAAQSLCAPQISVTCKDTNTLTIALTGDADVLVRGASTASGTFTATARNSATIKRKTVAGVEVPLNTNAYSVANIETSQLTFAATDSRGYTTSETVNKTIIPYVPLTCNVLRAYRPVPSSNEGVIELAGQYFSGSFGAVENALTLQYKTTAGDWADITPVIDQTKNTYTASVTVADLDYRQSYYIDVKATDKLREATTYARIMPGIPGWYWCKDFFRVNVPLMLGEETIFSKVYPVGSIYVSVSDTNPKDLFGGTWEAIGGRFLIGTGLNEANTKAWFGEDDFPAGAINIPAGDMGGNISHKLTVEQMPDHGHTMLYSDTAGTQSFGYQFGSKGARSGQPERSSGIGHTGGGIAHNNMPPYLAVYMWKRTA